MLRCLGRTGQGYGRSRCVHTHTAAPLLSHALSLSSNPLPHPSPSPLSPLPQLSPSPLSLTHVTSDLIAGVLRHPFHVVEPPAVGAIRQGPPQRAALVVGDGRRHLPHTGEWWGRGRGRGSGTWVSQHTERSGEITHINSTHAVSSRSRVRRRRDIIGAESGDAAPAEGTLS